MTIVQIIGKPDDSGTMFYGYRIPLFNIAIVHVMHAELNRASNVINIGEGACIWEMDDSQYNGFEETKLVRCVWRHTSNLPDAIRDHVRQLSLYLRDRCKDIISFSRLTKSPDLLDTFRSLDSSLMHGLPYKPKANRQTMASPISSDKFPTPFSSEEVM